MKKQKKCTLAEKNEKNVKKNEMILFCSFNIFNLHLIKVSN